MRFGMDFGGTNLKTGIFDESGETLRFVEQPLADFTKKGDLLENLIDHARQMVRDVDVHAGGLAIKGLINSDTGIMEDDVGAGLMFAGKNLRQPFADALGFPFVVENDARAYAWGEWKFGAGKGSKLLICMTLGTGLGCAVVKENQPYFGADVLGGILGGHISIDRFGPECACGNRGCAEIYCSATALMHRILNSHPKFHKLDDPLPDFFKSVQEIGGAYYETFRAYVEDLSIAVTNVIHAYGPDRVVLGGGVMNSANLILPELLPLVNKRAWTIPRGKVQICKAELGNTAAALGVAFHPKLENEN